MKLYRMHWKTLMQIVAVLMVPYTFVQQLVLRSVQNPYEYNGRVYVSPGDAERAAVATGVLLLFYLLFLYPLLTGAVVRAVAGAYLGETPTVGGVFNFAFSKIGALLWALFLEVLVVGGVTFGGTVLVALLALGAWPIAVLVGFGLVAAVTFLFVRYVFVPASVIVEGQRGGGALGRSWRLVEGGWWRIFGTIFLAYLLTQVVGLILGMPAVYAEQLVGTEGWILRAILQSISSVVTTPFITTLTVLLYFDMRIRKEGLDLAIMAQEVRPSGP